MSERVQIQCTYPNFERAYQWADTVDAYRREDGTAWFRVRYTDGEEFDLPAGRFLWTYEFRTLAS